MKKTIIIVIGSIAILILGYFAYNIINRANTVRAAQGNQETVGLERGTLVAQIGASGTVRSNQSAQLVWQTSGTVAEVKVAVGDRVSGGDELASLLESSVAQNVILAQADLVTAQKALDDLLNSTLQQAQAMQAVEDAQNTLADLNRKAAEESAQAQLDLANAEDALEEAEKTRARMDYPHTTDPLVIEKAETDYLFAKDAYKDALKEFNKVAHLKLTNLKRANALENIVAAEDAMERAFATYNWYLLGYTDVEIAQANGELAVAEATLEQAQAAWESLQGGSTQAEIALAEARLADALREWERLKDGPNPDDVAAAQARLMAAEAALDQVRIKAPFDGVVTQVSNKPGDQASPNTKAFRLDDQSRLLVDVEVSEVDINQIQVGQAAVLTFDSILGKEYHGRVVEVAPVGEEVQGVVNFTATVELTDADDQVKPGMTSSVTITVSELQDILLVPNRAVRTLDRERVVYVLKNGAAVPAPVPVTLGRTSDTHSELLEGDLREGDLIVLNPQTDLTQQFGPGAQGGGGNDPFGGGGQP